MIHIIDGDASVRQALAWLMRIARPDSTGVCRRTLTVGDSNEYPAQAVGEARGMAKYRCVVVSEPEAVTQTGISIFRPVASALR